MKIAVVGGGAAGLMAAGTARSNGADVTLFERNERLGVKLRITGKGRCNVTNNCTRQEFFDNVVSNPRFLYSAFSEFSNTDTMAFFENLGVPLKTERGNRVFPVSDRAADIADALIRCCTDAGVKILHERVKTIVHNGVFTVSTGNKEYKFDKVIIATGGLSYPRTGSTGDGYKFARAAGHTVTETSPSLVPLVCSDEICPLCQGLSLKNVNLSVYDTEKDKTVFSEQGEMLFTDNGVSGPLVLSASAHMSDIVDGKYKIYIDLKPALDRQTLDKRILRDFAENKNRDIVNSFSALLPSKLIAPFIELSGIPKNKKVNSVTAGERAVIVELLKKLPLSVISTAPVAEAVITRGGVDTKQIEPKTMQSKILPGLYFAGEIIDCDAYTGGFNLQIAFSTGYAAGYHASIT
jgi:hypothetical protein